MFNLNSVKIDGLIYVGSPYTLYPEGREAAFQEAARVTGLLIENGFIAFSPIVYSHPLAPFLRARTADQEHDLWMGIDRQIFRRCDALIVLMMEGWERSKGLTEEIAFFRWRKKPIWFCDCDTLHLEKEELE